MAKSSCSLTDDEATFSSKNHLEWNQKKHDMMLNLGITNNSETDQTPTPTRFIRNCEEVGLFQDLQNVNPFDEVFKKAVENPKMVTLKVPVNSTDDTLHTPQIYPHLEESSSTTTTITSEYSLNVIQSIDHDKDDEDNPLIIVLDPEKDDKQKKCEKITVSNTLLNVKLKKDCDINLKQKVIAAIMQKTSGLTPVPIKKLLDPKTLDPKTRAKTSQSNSSILETFKQREANRASQMRCRKRKQQEHEKMSLEIQNLKKQNIKLKSVNSCLQDKINKLEAELNASKTSCSLETGDLPSALINVENTSPIEVPSPINKQLNAVNINSNVSTEMKVNIGHKEPSKPAPIAPNFKKVIFPVPVQLPLPVQNIHNSSNSTVVFVYPGYIPPQVSALPQNRLVCQSGTLDTKNKIKSSFKKIVPK